MPFRPAMSKRSLEESDLLFDPLVSGTGSAGISTPHPSLRKGSTIIRARPLRSDTSAVGSEDCGTPKNVELETLRIVNRGECYDTFSTVAQIGIWPLRHTERAAGMARTNK